MEAEPERQSKQWKIMFLLEEAFAKTIVTGLMGERSFSLYELNADDISVPVSYTHLENYRLGATGGASTSPTKSGICQRKVF